MTTTLDKPDTRETAGDPRPQRRLNTPMLLAYLVLTVGIVVTLFPFMWMLLTSLKSFQELFNLSFLPESPTLDNYRQVLLETKFIQWFGNSLLVAGVTTATVLFFDSMVGYTLAKFDFPGKNLIFILILSTLMIPTEMLVIPWFVGVSDIHLTGSVPGAYFAIMFPGLMSAFGVFLMRQFFETLPDDLLEAARIDGMSEFGIFWRIALPLVRPALASLAIFTFLGNWNAFLWPLIVIQRPEFRTLPVGTALFNGEAGTQWGLIMAASSLAVIPVLIVFAIFQKQIIEGIVLTGMKG
ncbi:carbohydrate ABC transporter permease [Deinococcus sp. AJ005]|uniref:carbohydrate ABC transporter permease n=2 Tax=Deinococcus sp. AJ005 TaxID=2652443 RepID=UPI00125CCF2D|nr:carbohydrate ABC transporter permease [Deinococcus sp. AJ005]QFP75138.1 carbohydrate ABC transporter permease [Deinococcus sp. AJ005]QFP75434.1 carbohydrate ABC transporter permease [Deinococcus sp. AJ005]